MVETASTYAGAGASVNSLSDNQSARDSSWSLANINGALWAFGNGLVSTTLITYLAKDFGAKGAAISLILACPHLAGVLRLVAPIILDVAPNRKLWTIVTFTLSGLSLLLLPMLCWPGVLPSNTAALACLIALWALWHLWMYLGLVGFYSWLGDLADQDRATRFGLRETWMTAAPIAGTIVAATFSQWWNSWHAKEEQWIANAILAAAGGVMVMLSILPILFMRHSPRTGKHATSTTEMLAASLDRRFWPLLGFNVWFSFANGISASALAIYPFRLGIASATMLWFTSYMRIGQSITAPLAGRAFDARGYRWLMFAAQVIVAVGVLFYLPATKEQPWWIAGAWTCWIAYAVLNVGLPSVTLQLSPGANSPAYVAVAYAISGLSFAIASIIGGLAIDYWKPTAFDTLPALVLVGFVLRLTAAFWLLRLPGDRQTKEGTTAAN